MKKLIGLFAVIFIFSGCYGSYKVIDKEPSTLTQNVMAENTAAVISTEDEIHITEDDTDISDRELQAEENMRLAEKEPIFIFKNGYEVYEEDVTENGSGEIVCDFTFVYPSSGLYVEKSEEPQLFDDKHCRYIGKSTPKGGYTTVRAGDVIGKARIKSAHTVISRFYGNTVQYSSCIALEGEYTFTGLLSFNPLGQNEEDIFFRPDSSYRDMPLPTCENFEESGTAGYNAEGEIICYSETPVFVLGNYSESYADNGEIKKILGDGTKAVDKRVKITLKDLEIGSDIHSFGYAKAEIINIGEQTEVYG